MTTVKLYNKGKRTIHFGEPDVFDEVTGKVKEKKPKGSIAPEEARAIDEKLATKLKRLYPKELLSLEDVKNQFDNLGEKAVVPKEDMAAIIAAEVAKAVAAALAEERAKALEAIEKVAAPLISAEGDEIPTETEEEKQLREELEAEEKAAKAADKKKNK